ncbi:allantoinase [Hyphomonas beringensis]|uniref:Chitooligosaccharide deacetylase n=1 Tax=Hyphomonas beringensis TaxID=1280946 RepID=A0A062U9Q1_9PROT|nr:polysaccharide deacetylase family protein [Hyphomonas beringensis]KCZ53324.1 allantoinase [Hyphomonas beringensis]
MNLPSDPAPKDFAWPGGKKLALSIVVNVEEGAERRIDEGDKRPEPVDELGAVPGKPIRVHGNETNYQYGINQGAPRILRILDKAKMPATWTVCGQALEKAPWLAKAITARGDEPCNHGYKWNFTTFMTPEEERDFIKRGTESIEKTTGRRPSGWLSRYLHSDITRRIIIEQGYSYHMDDYSDDFPYWALTEMEDGSQKPIVILPYAIDTNDMKFWIAPSFTPEMWLDYAKRTFDFLREESKGQGARMMSLGLHLRIIGRPGRIDAFRAFLDYVATFEDVWVAKREDIAKHFAENVPAPN